MKLLAPQDSNVIEIFPKSKEEELSDILESFKINVKEVSLSSGSIIDTYSIRLSPGTKISKLEKILPEVGLHMQALSIPSGRMVLEKGIYEITLQTGYPSSFHLDYNLVSESRGEMVCPIYLGRDNMGNNIVQDLNQMPNLLVAGTTGSGKSMFLHSIFLSAAANNSDIYLIDPKGVEFDPYKDLQCVKFFTSDIAGARDILIRLQGHMSNVFALMQKAGARNILEYNRRSKVQIKPSVVIIDEWADLVMQDKKIQNELCFLAQKGRAAGISIVLATQRPSASVISGPIKANFPARVAMRVTSLVDSRVILDSSGAEKLAKAGSGIYLDPKTGELKHFFAPKIDSISNEIKKLGLKKTVSFWKMIWG